MAAEHVSISIDAELAEEVREALDAIARQVAAWQADGRQERASQGLREVVEAWEAEHGSFSEEELAAVDARLGW